jgi:hypothetical protein
MKRTCSHCGLAYNDNAAVNEMKAALAIGNPVPADLPKNGPEQLARSFCSVPCGLAFALVEVTNLYGEVK